MKIHLGWFSESAKYESRRHRFNGNAGSYWINSTLWCSAGRTLHNGYSLAFGGNHLLSLGKDGYCRSIMIMGR